MGVVCREAGVPSAPWDSLCDDVKPAILSHLSLPDLARAAVAGRELQGAYRVRLVAERQNLHTLTDETYNQPLVKAFVGAVRQAMCKSGRQRLDWVHKHSSLAVIDMSGHFRPQKDISFAYHKSAATLHAHARPLWSDGHSEAFMSLSGMVFHEEEDGGWRGMGFDVYQSCNSDVRVGLNVTAGKGLASAAVGLLLATCTGYLEDMPASRQTLGSVTLVLTGFPLGARGRKEAECLIAPVRHLAKSVVIEETEMPRPEWVEPARMVSGGFLEYPLGHLRVLIVIPYRMTREE
jgi:hypothetical protein